MPRPGDRAKGPPLLTTPEAFGLYGRTALVTGAARGLGRAIARGLAEAGADVAGLDVLELSETCADVEALGRRFHPIVRDLRGLDAAGAEAVVADAAGALGGLDVLVNNAGLIRRGPALSLEADNWRPVIDVILDAAFFLGQAAARRFVAQGGGRIVNTASVLSFQGGFLVASYAAAKSALVGLTRALANEWAAQGVNVNAIAPGYIATELTKAIREDPERARSLLERIPAGRFGEPAEVAGAVVFLASDAAAYVHGAVLPVDGGWLSR